MTIQPRLPDVEPYFSVAQNQCQIVSNEVVNAEYRLLVAEAGDVALSARPGQFFHLLCPQNGKDRPFLRRPMSIYRIDLSSRRVGFLYKVTGKGTRGLATLGPGDILDALGPLGKGFTVPKTAKHVLMVGRGVGLATLAPLARLAVSGGAEVTAILSARRRDLLMSKAELEAAGAHVIEVTDEEGTSDVPALTATIRSLHERAPFDFAATCGSNRLFQMTRSLCSDWDIPGEAALEAFMGCGTGMCYACVIPTISGGQESYRRVCCEGPVFPIREVSAW
jgi:dihydroorotate dehydrogenase electron transfer subunit